MLGLRRFPFGRILGNLFICGRRRRGKRSKQCTQTGREDKAGRARAGTRKAGSTASRAGQAEKTGQAYSTHREFGKAGRTSKAGRRLTRQGQGWAAHAGQAQSRQDMQ